MMILYCCIDIAQILETGGNVVNAASTSLSIGIAAPIEKILCDQVHDWLLMFRNLNVC